MSIAHEHAAIVRSVHAALYELSAFDDKSYQAQRIANVRDFLHRIERAANAALATTANTALPMPLGEVRRRPADRGDK